MTDRFSNFLLKSKLLNVFNVVVGVVLVSFVMTQFFHLLKKPPITLESVELVSQTQETYTIKGIYEKNYICPGTWLLRYTTTIGASLPTVIAEGPLGLNDVGFYEITLELPYPEDVEPGTVFYYQELDISHCGSEEYLTRSLWLPIERPL